MTNVLFGEKSSLILPLSLFFTLSDFFWVVFLYFSGITSLDILMREKEHQLGV